MCLGSNVSAFDVRLLVRLALGLLWPLRQGTSALQIGAAALRAPIPPSMFCVNNRRA